MSRAPNLRDGLAMRDEAAADQERDDGSATTGVLLLIIQGATCGGMPPHVCAVRPPVQRGLADQVSINSGLGKARATFCQGMNLKLLLTFSSSPSSSTTTCGSLAPS